MKRHFDLLEDSKDFLDSAWDLFRTGKWSKVCFMSQQAAELAVKAALHALGKEKFGHDVHKLLEELSENITEVSEFIDDAKILDQYHIPTRYANAFAEGSAKSHFTKNQAEDALHKAQKILNTMERIIKGKK